MPILIRKVEGEIFRHNMGGILYLRPITGEVQREDYINVHGFVAYLQNLTEVCETTRAEPPLNFGLFNIKNLPIVTLDFCYENIEPTPEPIVDDETIEYYVGIDSF